MNEEVTLHNFEQLFKDPGSSYSTTQYRSTQRQLEITELTSSECFGEDHGALVHGFQNYDEVLSYKLPYTAISSVPLDVYMIKKRYLYFYLDDVAKQQFLSFLKKYPSDEQLRRYYIEQQNWKDYCKRTRAKSTLRCDLPKHLRNNVQRLEEIEQDEKRQKRLNSQVTLPKINKKE